MSFALIRITIRDGGTGALPSHYLNQYWFIISEAIDIHIRAISRQMPQPSINKISLKIKYLKFHSNLSGANELRIKLPKPGKAYRISELSETIILIMTCPMFATLYNVSHSLIRMIKHNIRWWSINTQVAEWHKSTFFMNPIPMLK